MSTNGLKLMNSEKLQKLFPIWPHITNPCGFWLQKRETWPNGHMVTETVSRWLHSYITTEYMYNTVVTNQMA